MARIVSFLALLAAVAARPSWNELDNYTFEQFLQEFNLNYHPSELPARKALFETEMARIKAHNSGNPSWKEGVTKFTTMTPAEKTAYFGRSKGMHKSYRKNLASNKSIRDLPSDFVLQPVDRLPKNVDWRDAGIVTSVKDQGHCGSCWAFAATAVIESHVAKSSGLLFDLSVQQVAMCSPNPNHCGGTGGCQGATSELAFDYVAKSGGLFQEYQYSYSSYYGKESECVIPSSAPVAMIDGYVQLPMNNNTALMNAIARVGPVAISVDASSWHSYDSGIYDGCNQKNPDINHAVILVGYGEENGKKYWLVRNSWSPKWGEKGYIRLARTEDEQGRCGIDLDPSNGISCEGDSEPQNVCGTCGILFDSAYPVKARVL